jgi:hypothetical protein
MLYVIIEQSVSASLRPQNDSHTIMMQPTRSFALLFLAMIIGFAVTLMIKILILTVLRKYFHNGFFRNRPAASNFLGLILDCWYLGLSSGYMSIRALVLILVAILNIGRIDRPILADGIDKFGPLVLDCYPVSFRKDLLQHEVGNLLYTAFGVHLFHVCASVSCSIFSSLFVL